MIDCKRSFRKWQKLTAARTGKTVRAGLGGVLAAGALAGASLTVTGSIEPRTVTGWPSPAPALRAAGPAPGCPRATPTVEHPVEQALHEGMAGRGPDSRLEADPGPGRVAVESRISRDRAP